MQPFQSKHNFRVGFIGLGDHADEQLLPALSTIPNVELTAITSRNPEKLVKFADKFKPKFTSLNWEELINPEIIDAIIVSSSPELHYKVAKKALENNLHIFIEKPPAENLTQLQELVNLQNIFNKVKSKTFVGYNFTFSDAFEKLQKPLGQIKFFRSKFISSRPQTLNYHYQSVLEYALFSMLIHPLATLIKTLGKVQNHTFQLTQFDKINFRMTNFLECERGNGVIEWGNFSNRFECDFELVDEFGQSGKCCDLWNLEFDLNPKNSANLADQNSEQKLEIGDENQLETKNQTEKLAKIKESIENTNQHNSKIEIEQKAGENPKKPFQKELKSTQFGKYFKNKQTNNYHFSPLSGGFGRTGYENQFLDFFHSIEQNTPTRSEISESLEIYRVLEQILSKIKDSFI